VFLLLLFTPAASLCTLWYDMCLCQLKVIEELVLGYLQSLKSCQRFHLSGMTNNSVFHHSQICLNVFIAVQRWKNLSTWEPHGTSYNSNNSLIV